jgi:hypothetical protein
MLQKIPHIRKLFRILGAGLALFPAVSFAAPANFRDVVELALGFLRGIVGIAWAFLLFAFIYNVIKFLLNFDDERAREEGKRAMVFSLVATAVLLMIWGIIALLSNSVFGNGPLKIRLLTPPS